MMKSEAQPVAGRATSARRARLRSRRRGAAVQAFPLELPSRGTPEGTGRAVGEALDGGAGVVVVRGLQLAPADLVALTAAVGGSDAAVEDNPGVPERFLEPGLPQVQRLGNVPGALFVPQPALERDDGTARSLAFDPARASTSPVWHTDQVFRDPPPRGSILYCVEAPAGGGSDTCFADTVAAAAALPDAERERWRRRLAVCSYAHHNAKIRRRQGADVPVIESAVWPPVLRPVVSEHPTTGADTLYCFSSAVCALVDAGDASRLEELGLEAWEVHGVEDDSAAEMRGLLAFATQERFVYRHKWRAGDLVAWDNHGTIHAATAFDEERDRRLVLRTTFQGGPQQLGGSTPSSR